MDERTTLFLRGVPTRLVREAKAAAARRGSTLAALVSDSLTHSLAAGGLGEAPADELRESKRWYERHRAALVGRYRGEYLAVIDRKIVDHDRDFSVLAARVFAKHGTRPVFMPHVSERDEPARLRSPRVVRR